MEVGWLTQELSLKNSSVSSQKLVETFRQDCEDRHMTPESIRRYISAITLFLHLLSERKISALSADRHLLKELIHIRRTSGGKTGAGIAQKTLENDLSAISCFYEYLTFEGYIPYNPVPAVRKRYLMRYKDAEGDDSPRKLISVEEMAMLINSILDTRDKAIATLLAKTGVRRGEMISMDVDEIDWEEQSITLKAKRFKKRSGRIIFFDDECTRILKGWLKMRESMKPKTKALFLNENRNRLDRNGIYSLITKHAQKVGLHDSESDRTEDHFSPHCFRHWFTTHLRRSGMNREFIKELRGDKRRDAIDIYDHIDKEELRRTYLAHIPQLGV